MGLDIFFWRTRRNTETICANGKTDWNAIYSESKAEAQDSFRKAYDGMLKKLSTISPERYTDAATAEIRRLARLTNYPLFDLHCIGYDKEGIRPAAINTLRKMEGKICEGLCAMHDAYFRKVNFLYGYFKNRGLLHDDEFAWVDRNTVEDIIDRCDKVSRDKSLAEELLPCYDGPLFGSTEYDDIYYSDVKDVRRQMKVLLKNMDEGWNYFVEMNW